MSMDSIILAAGSGTRLGELTKHKAKSLLEVGGRPVLSYILDKLRQLYKDHPGTCYLTVNIDYQADFQKFLEQEKIDFPLELVVEKERKGFEVSLNQLLTAHDFSEGVLVLAGDSIFSFDLRDLIDYYKEHPQRSIIALYDVKDPEKAKPYGCIELSQEDHLGRKILNFEEKPEHPRSTVVNVTCFVLNPADLERIRKHYDPTGDRCHLDWLVTDQKSELNGYKFEGYWFDIGMPEALKQADEFLRKQH